MTLKNSKYKMKPVQKDYFMSENEREMTPCGFQIEAPEIKTQNCG